jgi:hypothetical protein
MSSCVDSGPGLKPDFAMIGNRFQLRDLYFRDQETNHIISKFEENHAYSVWGTPKSSM